MSSKKVPVPVRIGLTKKPANSASAVELENDISDLLSESTMDALDEIVQDVHEIQEDEDDGRFYELPELEDELDRDTDPGQAQAQHQRKERVCSINLKYYQKGHSIF